ncbi:tetratricopeptide repeat protein [Gracilimonas sp. BCB1]|uniref:tetratricopeptide repeat protein n=1 Tax=Gracilimonas sp. BCB1 TaxID=3152362 RepID=UPI0032D90B11
MSLNLGMRIILTLFLLLFIISACNSEKTQIENKVDVDSLAIQLSNSATERFGEYIFGRIDSPDSLEVSLSELDKAIEIEPNLTELYTHKANILLALDRDEQAIQVLNKALSIKPDFVEVMTLIGFINEKIEKSEVAQEWYQKALEGYDKRIEEKRFVINSKINKVFLLLFTQDEEAARKAYKNLKQEYPNNSEVEFMEQFLFIDFDKEKFLNELYK